MKKLILIVGILFLSSIFLSSCQPKIDFGKEKNEILTYLETCKKAQIENDWETWASLYAENTVYIEKGEIKRYTRDSITNLSKDYFTNRSVKYNSLEDLTDPIIYISDDATMAWYIVNYRFNFILTDSLGNETEDHSDGAGLFILKKENGKWVEVTGFNSSKPKDK